MSSIGNGFSEKDLSDIDSEWLALAKDILLKSPDNFSQWENLIQKTESLNGGISKISSSQDIKLFKTIYENFLNKFPYMEKYWCDYSYWLVKLDDFPLAIEMMEKALNFLPNSIIIWLNYLNIVKLVESDDSKLVKFLERCRLKIGLHYLSHDFYDFYLNFLLKNHYEREYYILLRKILEIPLYHYGKYFKKWFETIENLDLKKLQFILNSKDFKKLGVNAKKLDNSILPDIKVKLKKWYIDLYITTQYHSYQLYQFEKNIKTTFCVIDRDLGKAETDNWERYLQFLETNNLLMKNSKDTVLKKLNENFIELTYERCLYITGSSMEKFWIKYSNYYLNRNQLSKSKEVLKKSLHVLPFTCLKVRLKLIDLELLTDDLPTARSNILEIYKIFPNNLEVFSKLLIIEKLAFDNKEKQDLEDYIIDLITFKIDSLLDSKFEYKFDILFDELIEFKFIRNEKILKIFQKYESKKTSYFFWKSYLEFLRFNENDNAANGNLTELKRIWKLGFDKLENHTDKQKLLRFKELFLVQDQSDLDDLLLNF